MASEERYLWFFNFEFHGEARIWWAYFRDLQEAEGMTFGTYDTIYVVIGLLFVLGAAYAMINLRGLKLAE